MMLGLGSWIAGKILIQNLQGLFASLEHKIFTLTLWKIIFRNIALSGWPL